MRKSPATFSSKKPPAASDSPAQLRLLSNNVGGARPRTPTLASSTAGHPNAAAASTTPHSPSARDLELMRIFQKDARRTPPLATLNSNAMAGVRTNANAFGGSGGAVGWSASASTEEVVNVDNRKVPVRMSTLEQENRSIGAGHSNALLKGVFDFEFYSYIHWHWNWKFYLLNSEDISQFTGFKEIQHGFKIFSFVLIDRYTIQKYCRQSYQ